MKLYVTARVLSELTGRSVDSIYIDARAAKFPTRRVPKQRETFFSLDAAEQRYGNKFQYDLVLAAVAKFSKPAAVAVE